MVTVIPPPDLTDTRATFLLAEDRLGHYPEFRDFFVRAFDLDRVGLSAPGYVATASGSVYRLTFIGRSGEAFPSGLEIAAIVPALEPLDDDGADRDLWSILKWTADGVGGAWSADLLDRTGRLYRLAAALDP
jgi:hypothetical protein